MNDSVDPPAVARSQRLFERLLAVYPREHRWDYGPAMAQLFHDQCREAWQEARGWGLAALWLRVLPDLVKTSVLEHLANLKGRKPMIERISALLRPRSARVLVFLAVFAGVFLLVFTTAAVVTFLLPESYASTARIRVERDATDLAPTADARPPSPSYDPYFIQTEFEVIQSEVILDQVIDALNLDRAWAKKYGAAGQLTTSETRGLLKRVLDLRPVRNTSLIEIRVYSDQPQEAADIANKLAEVYRDYRLEQQRHSRLAVTAAWEERVKVQEERAVSAQENVDRLRRELQVPNPEPAMDTLQAMYGPYWEAKRALDVARRFLDELRMKDESAKLDARLQKTAPVELVDRAVPGLRPVRPNKPLNLFLGAMIGLFLGLATGGVAAWTASRIGHSLPRNPAAP